MSRDGRDGRGHQELVTLLRVRKSVGWKTPTRRRNGTESIYSALINRWVAKCGTQGSTTIIHCSTTTSHDQP